MFFNTGLCSTMDECGYVPYTHVMFSPVPFQQQEVHSVGTIDVLADVQRGESALVTYAKHVYTYRFVHLFEFGDVSSGKASPSVSRVLLYIR